VFAADWSPDGQALAVVVRDASGRSRIEFPVDATIYETESGIGRSVRVSPGGDRSLSSSPRAEAPPS